jgi:hypothetical protein
MVNYSNGKIYKIESHLGDKIYIGSTTKQYLSQRMDQHRGDYKVWKNGKTGKTTSFELFNEYGVENCQIILLESCPCNTKDELISRESHYIKSLDCVNKKIEGRTKKEWLDDNKGSILEKNKVYYEVNKEKLNEQSKIYYQENKETIIENNKMYYETNKDERKKRSNEYYEKNKDKIIEYRRSIFNCECGVTCAILSKTKHFKSKKHLRNLEAINAN